MDHLLSSIVEQVRMAYQRKNRLAMILGSVLGSIIPIATYVVAHQDVNNNKAFWILVAGGLMFSAMTVYDWTKIAFQSGFKAFGFCLLIEGVMTFSGVLWLSYVALGVLSIINGIGTGCKIALNQKAYQVKKRSEQKPLGMQRAKPVAARKESVAA